VERSGSKGLQASLQTTTEAIDCADNLWLTCGPYHKSGITPEKVENRLILFPVIATKRELPEKTIDT